MKIFRNTGINLKIIIGVIIPVICTFIVFLLIVTLLLNAKIEKLFRDDLIPFFNTRLAEMEKEVGSVLYEHSEENRKSFESLYTNEMENLAKALAETALPLAESFDYEAIERLLAEHLLKTGDTEQFIRIYLENSSSPAMEKGTLPDEPMTFFYVTQSDFGYVKIALLVSQNPLRELFRREDERMTHISDHIRNIGGKMSASISSQSITFKSEIMTGLYRWVSILGSGVILFVSTGLFIFITKNIIIPLKRIVGGLKKISDEELLASEHLASASQLMAKNAAEQAMLIENTGKTIEKTAKMVKQNAGRADKAQKMTQENFLIREKVSSRMSEMSDAIARIAETGRKTTTIVKTIDEIAFQTKLLALNAAVEAAHAGNAGAGFGIIAEEVRNLALKSGSAAKETSDMIEDMLNYIQQGSRLTDAAQETFKKNMEVAAGTGQLVKEIAEASVGQTRNAQQISQAMSKADDAVQRNAVGAEENAAIAEQINENAAQIQLFVSELKNVLAGRQ